jgi:hypothetical protein
MHRGNRRDNGATFQCSRFSFAFNARTGGVLSSEKAVATSAPLAIGNQVVLTRKVQPPAKMYEGMVRIDAQRGEEKDKDKELIARTDADHLREDRGTGAAMPVVCRKALTLPLDSSALSGHTIHWARI